jgi:hypothetical protein
MIVCAKDYEAMETGSEVQDEADGFVDRGGDHSFARVGEQPLRDKGDTEEQGSPCSVGDDNLQYLQKARAESAERAAEAREEEDNHEQNRGGAIAMIYRKG